MNPVAKRAVLSDHLNYNAFARPNGEPQPMKTEALGERTAISFVPDELGFYTLRRGPKLLSAFAVNGSPDESDLRPIDRMADITAPVLLVAGTRDDRTTIAEATAMFERAREPKWLWEVEGARHVDLEAYAAGEYRHRVLPFLTERLQQAP